MCIRDRDTDGDGYTNLEEYLNGDYITPTTPPTTTTTLPSETTTPTTPPTTTPTTPPEPTPTPTPSYPTPSGGGGGGGYIDIVSTQVKPIEQNITQTVPIITAPVIGDIDISIQSIDTIENGEPFTVTLILKSTADTASDVLIQGKFATADTEQVFDTKETKVSLTANEEKRLAFDFIAPAQFKGVFSVAASATGDGIETSETSKQMSIDYKPLVLDVKEMPGEKKSISITALSFEENAQTEIEVIINNRETAFLELIQGKKEYNSVIELLKPGAYQIKAVSKSQQGIIDEDIRYVTVEGETSPDEWINFAMAGIVVGILALIGVIIWIIGVIREDKEI